MKAARPEDALSALLAKTFTSDGRMEPSSSNRGQRAIADGAQMSNPARSWDPPKHQARLERHHEIDRAGAAPYLTPAHESHRPVLALTPSAANCVGAGGSTQPQYSALTSLPMQDSLDLVPSQLPSAGAVRATRVAATFGRWAFEQARPQAATIQMQNSYLADSLPAATGFAVTSSAAAPVTAASVSAPDPQFPAASPSFTPSIGFNADQNSRWRQYMEDEHKTMLSLERLGRGSIYCGLYDGHGGRSAVEFVAEHLHTAVNTELRGPPSAHAAALSADVHAACKQAFARVDRMLLQEGATHCGTTVAACIFSPRGTGTRNGISAELHVANVGDSRVLLIGNSPFGHMNRKKSTSSIGL